MDSGGLETVVLYPTAGLSVGYLGEQDYAAAWCRAYNDYLSEEYLKASPRFKGVALLPLQEPAEAAKELGVARRISIPSIGLESGVEELQILDLGDSLSYETPKNTVGHIPETSNPCQLGNGWFFGHLESPVRGEGNVFQHLPDIPKLLQNGDPVYITIETDEGAFLYQATKTVQVHEDDLRLHDTSNASITLVACVPRLVYDHRLLVTAELVGVKN